MKEAVTLTLDRGMVDILHGAALIAAARLRQDAAWAEQQGWDGVVKAARAEAAAAQEAAGALARAMREEV